MGFTNPHCIDFVITKPDVSTRPISQDFGQRIAEDRHLGILETQNNIKLSLLRWDYTVKTPHYSGKLHGAHHHRDKGLNEVVKPRYTKQFHKQPDHPIGGSGLPVHHPG